MGMLFFTTDPLASVVDSKTVTEERARSQVAELFELNIPQLITVDAK